LACRPLTQLTAKDIATAYKKGGMKELSYCRFFPDGSPPPFGDPLGSQRDIDEALMTFRSDLGLISELRSEGLTVRHITGPGGFVLARQYDLDPTTMMSRMVDYYKRVADLIDGSGVQVNVEYLRPGEDYVLQSMTRACELIDKVDCPAIKIHADVFHAHERHENPCAVLQMAGKRLGYLHAHGTKRQYPGAFHVSGDANATDTTNWHLIACVLDDIKFDGPIVPEPFGEVVRREIPALGDGLPPAVPPEAYYKAAFTHLTKMGII
jgi:sugar phosphate isomerase/epimerase